MTLTSNLGFRLFSTGRRTSFLVIGARNTTRYTDAKSTYDKHRATTKRSIDASRRPLSLLLVASFYASSHCLFHLDDPFAPLFRELRLFEPRVQTTEASRLFSGRLRPNDHQFQLRRRVPYLSFQTGTPFLRKLKCSPRQRTNGDHLPRDLRFFSLARFEINKPTIVHQTGRTMSLTFLRNCINLAVRFGW